MNFGFAAFLLILVAGASWHASAWMARLQLARDCDALLSFAVADRVYVCEQQAKVRARLGEERRKVEKLERGNP